MLQSQTERYLETAVQTATPAQLLLMLYDGAIRFCRAGAEAIKQRDYAAANTYLQKTQAIIRELLVTLDRRYPVAEPLSQLYDYFLNRLLQANLKKDPAPAEEVLGYLVDLKNTWAEAAKLASKGAASAHG